MPADITKHGTNGLKGLEGLPSLEEAQEWGRRSQSGILGPTTGSDMSSLHSYGYDSPMGQWGSSKYDNTFENAPLVNNQMQDTRYENQPWYDTLANGVGKMLGTAGTTFVSSLVGLPTGIAAVGRGLIEGEENPWANMWDNDVTNALGDVDKWLEENMTNYKSTEQQNAPWYSLTNLGSMNFWADDVIKNAGFTLGAASSMAVGSGSLGLLAKSLGFVNDVHKGVGMGSKVASALFSATGEGMIEARNGVEERNKLKFQELEDALAPEKQALEEQFNLVNEEYQANKGLSLQRGSDGQLYDLAYKVYKQKMSVLAQQRDELNKKMEYGRQEIIDSGREMGNKILAGNQVLLTADNIIQFSKLMNKSFNNARHAAEVTSKTSKPFLAGAERVSSNLADGYKTTGKGIGRLHAATKGIFTEGSEEMNQQWIQNTAGYTEERKDINDYWKAKYDPEAYKDTSRGLYTLGQAINQGFKDSWGDIDQWEQFVIGGLTGMAGSYAPTKLFNQDKTKSRWDPRRYGEWSGGAINEVRDFNNEFNQYQENIDDLNKALAQEDFGERTRNLIAHTYLESSKEKALQENDKKAWKDEDDKQAIHDIQAFLRAGKLDDLRAIYDEMGKDMSDDEIEDIVKRNTKEITAEEDKRNYDREIDAQIGQHQQRIAEINSRIDDYTDALEVFSDGAERSSYLTTITPRIAELREEVRKEEDAIQNLNQQKDAYTGQKRFEGAYLDDKGNRIKSNDEIREEIKHNTEELNRKLDGYLDSINFVNQRTNGQLTKDQEDNLAYLHNMGKESLNRADKIMSNVRQSLPTKFLLKTSKTPEELAKENGSSDLTFAKDENTKEGYVEVDTSLMNDHSFADFFLRNVLWGGNIRPEFGETADERAIREEEEKGLNEEEKKKRRTAKWKKALEDAQNDAKEQNNTNVDLMVQNFLDNYRKNNRSNQAEAFDALNSMLGDIADASSLMQQAGEYYRTLDDYLKHPEKIDQDKEKEEKKADKKNAEEDAKSKFAGKTAKEINQDISNGNISEEDVDDFSVADLSDITDEDSKQALEAAKSEAQKSKEIRQKQAEAKGAILQKADEEGYNSASVDAALNAIDTMAANADDAADINLDNVAAAIPPSDYEGADVGVSEAEKLAQQVTDLVAEGLNAWKENQDKKDDIPDPSTAVNFREPEDTGHDSTTKVPAETAAPKVETPQNSDEWEQPTPTNTLTSEAVDTIVEELRKASEEPAKAGTWRSTTRRYGRRQNAAGGWYATNVPYHELISDKNSLRYKRSKAIWEYLDAQGTWDRIENAGKDRLKAGDKIHFMVKNFANEIFGKDFEDCTEEEKSQALVILMLNDNGEVLGDLPLAQLEPSYNNGDESKMTQQVKELVSTQKMLFDAFEEKRKQTGCNEAIADKTLQKDGVENLGLTFNNRTKSPFMSEISQVLNGMVPFGSEVNTLNDVMGNENLLLGISVTGETIATSRDKKDRRGGAARGTRTGNIGQPYLLMPSASGALMAVPFYTKAFDAQRHQGTELYRLLTESITSLLQDAINKKEDANSYKEAMDIIQALLQVRPQEGAKSTVEIKDNQVIMHLQSLVDADRKIDITIPNTGDVTAMATAIANQMSGTNINISLQFINTKIGRKGGRTADYNKVIGEIAEVNLPKNTTHTRNNWFTIKLSTQAGNKRNEVRYQQSGKQTVNLNGRTIQIDTDNFTAVRIDPTTKEEIPIEGDEEVNLLLAEVKAAQQADKTKNFKITLDGEVRICKITDNGKVEFVKASQGTGVNAGQESLNKQRDERRERRNEIRTYINDNIRSLNVAGSNAIIDDILEIDPSLDTQKIAGLIEKAFNRSPAAAKWLIEHSGFRNKLITLIRKSNTTQENQTTSNVSPATTTSNTEETTSTQQVAQGAISFSNDSAQQPTKQQWSDTPEHRVQNSKLLHKQDILDVYDDTDGGLQITIKAIDGSGRTAIIGFSNSKKKFTLQVNTLQGEDAVYPSEEQINNMVNYYLPKELQDFFTSGEYEKIDGDAHALHKQMKAENPNVDSNEIAWAINRMPNKLRDTFGIFTIRERFDGTKETNDLEDPQNSNLDLFRQGAKQSLDSLNQQIARSIQQQRDDELDLILAGVSEEDMDKVRGGKTLTEIEKEVADAGIINRRNQDAWNAIPAALKLKMANAGIGIVLEYGREKVTLDYRNLDDMKEKLKEANKYAKSGNLTVSEGAKYRRATTEAQRKANIQKERKWLQKNLPMFNTEERLHLLHGLLEIPGEEHWAWGRFEKGIITLSDMAARGTIYHEAFHAVTQTLLSDEELDNLYEAAVKHYKEKDTALVEELLAEDFRKYVQRGETPIIGPILKVFRKLINAIRNISGYRAPIHQLFYRINNGEFSDSIPRSLRSGNAFYSLAKNYSLDKNDPMVQYIINDGISRGLKGLNKEAVIGKWNRYVNYWQAQGYRPIGHWNEKTHSYDIKEVMLNSDYIKWKEAEEEKRTSDYAQALKEYKEKQQALQARVARREMTQWGRLSSEQQMSLMNEGMTENIWNNLSVTEREQWLECHG